MNEFRENLWAPWRMEYIQALADINRTGDGEAPASHSPCFLCEYRDAPQNDGANHVLWRADGMLVLLNRFPYTNGHLLIAPTAHKADLDDLADSEMTALLRCTRDVKRLLTESLSAQGFNIGINFGLCAGAGLPGHLHAHVVPRWNGDTNFMSVIGDVRVIPQALDRLHAHLSEISAKLGLPRSKT